ncbi:hypothetical protein MIND_00582100 [Mycena indigotica]|uniref:Uncharacterized protein n=1 Tax=Mycena indigotica TaxID=2126181 RepID=A0A8H6SQE8_9AGAR|nr:uncharacterized protein MIND_00582100 [Mycena indigotica]KAF7303529.1 hypothetical protein MIND_00582100 [Mycena indigotica]
MHDVDKAAPQLPPELEREICELAGWNDDETMRTLICVARRFYEWLEPLRYRVVSLSSAEDDLFMSHFLGLFPESAAGLPGPPPSSLPQPDRSSQVRHLALSSQMARSTVEHILRTTTNVTDLAIWTGDTYPELLEAMQPLTQLRHLSVNLSELLWNVDDVAAPSAAKFRPFAQLTHLDIFGHMPLSAQMIPILGMLPALTHLALTDMWDPPFIWKTLAECGERLRVLVVLWTDREEVDPGVPDEFASDGERADEIGDPRFCAVYCSQFEDDWRRGAWGERDFWAMAEERLRWRAVKRQRKLEGNLRSA